jgi:hypothetical protein
MEGIATDTYSNIKKNFFCGPAGRAAFLLLSSLISVSYRPCGAAGALFFFYLCRLDGGGAFFSLVGKEAKAPSRNYVP